MKIGDISLRYELKYRISYGDYYHLRHIVRDILKMDGNSFQDGYHIRSLYFDDYNDSAMIEKNAGIKIRKKFRIRIYNKSDKTIKLERKSKFGQFINKEVYTLSKDCYDRILENDYSKLLSSGNEMALEFYSEAKSNVLRPKVIVDYVREAYVDDVFDVRITFDKYLSTASPCADMFSDIPTSKVMDEGEMILEVKFNDYLPQVIQDFLQVINRKTMALSKYVMCRQKLDY